MNHVLRTWFCFRPPRGGQTCGAFIEGPLGLFQLQLLLVRLFFLLEFDVFPDHLTVESYRIYTVAFRPKMISPIRLLPHPRKNIEYSDRGTSFQDTHQFRYRYLWWHSHQQMYMINLHIQLYHLTTQLLAERHYAFLNFTTNRTAQYPIPVFRHPNQMILTMPQNMRCSFEPAHFRFLSRLLWGQHRVRYFFGQVSRSNRQSLLGDNHVLRTWISSCY